MKTAHHGAADQQHGNACVAGDLPQLGDRRIFLGHDFLELDAAPGEDASRPAAGRAAVRVSEQLD
jgi:hypothetical protein